MATLEQFSFIPSSLSGFLNTLSAQLATVVDISVPTPKKLFNSIYLGENLGLTSSILTTPNPEECPCCILTVDDENITYDNSADVPLFMNVPITLNCIWALDYPSVNFIQLREAAVMSVLNSLKYDFFASDNYYGMKTQRYWKFSHDSIQVQHNATIKILGKQVQQNPTSNFSVSRIPIMIMLKTYLQQSDYLQPDGSSI